MSLELCLHREGTDYCSKRASTICVVYRDPLHQWRHQENDLFQYEGGLQCSVEWLLVWLSKTEQRTLIGLLLDCKAD